VLLDAGADVNEADTSSMTCLHVAAHHGHLSIVRLLLERGAEARLADGGRRTAWSFATAAKKHEVAALLQSPPPKGDCSQVPMVQIPRRLPSPLRLLLRMCGCLPVLACT
jgi:ankyrin repeat protein